MQIKPTTNLTKLDIMFMMRLVIVSVLSLREKSEASVHVSWKRSCSFSRLYASTIQAHLSVMCKEIHFIGPGVSVLALLARAQIMYACKIWSASSASLLAPSRELFHKKFCAIFLMVKVAPFLHFLCRLVESHNNQAPPWTLCASADEASHT